MHLTTTTPVSGVWRQNTRAGVIPAISLTRLSRRNARISAHAMRMRAFSRMGCECAHMRAFSRMGCECAHFAHAMRMLAHARISPHAMRCGAMRMRACDAMRMRASRGNLCVSGTVCVTRPQWVLNASFTNCHFLDRVLFHHDFHHDSCA